MAAAKSTGAARSKSATEKCLEASKADLQLRMANPTLQNWVFNEAEAKFLEGKTPGKAAGAFDQLSIQALPASDQVKLARITGVQEKHKSASKDEAKSLMYAALIAKEVKSGVGEGQEAERELGFVSNEVMLMNALARSIEGLEYKVTGKTECERSEVYVEDGKGTYARKGFFSNKKGFEAASSDPKFRNDWQWRYASTFSSTFGLPQVVAGCSKRSKLVVLTPFLKDAPSVAVPPLWDLIYPSSRPGEAVTDRLRQEPVALMDETTKAQLAKYRRVELSADAQRVLAMRTLAQIRILHIFGYAHNRITPHTLRVDVTNQMTVYLMDLRDIAIVLGNSRFTQGDGVGEPSADALAFDLYSAFATFTTLGLTEAAAHIAAASSDPADWRSFPATPKQNGERYQKYPVWKEQHTKRIGNLALTG